MTQCFQPAEHVRECIDMALAANQLLRAREQEVHECLGQCEGQQHDAAMWMCTVE